MKPKTLPTKLQNKIKCELNLWSMQMNIIYTKGSKTKDANYPELFTKHEAKNTNSGTCTV